MKKNIKHLVLAVLAALLILNACKEKQEIEVSSGEIEFQVPLENSEARTNSTSNTPSYMSLTLEGEEGTETYTLEIFQYPGYYQDYDYYTKPLTLKTGSYQLTDLTIMNDDDETIYAIPKVNSELEDFVENPLPIPFEISQGEKTLLETELLAISPHSPEAFGYTNLDYNLTMPFRISVFGNVYDNFNPLYNNYTNIHYDFLDPMLYIYDDPVMLNTIHLEPKENLIKTEGMHNIYILWLEKHGYERFEEVYDWDSLVQHSTYPLTIEMEPAITIESNNLNSMILKTWTSITYHVDFGLGSYLSGDYTVDDELLILPRDKPTSQRCFVSITGRIQNLYGLYLEDNDITELSIERATNILYFKLNNALIDSLSLLVNYNLRSVEATGNANLHTVLLNTNNHIKNLVLTDNNLSTTAIDYILETMYLSGDVNGDAFIDLRNNQPPSATGIAYAKRMQNEYNWEVWYDIP